MTILAVVCVLLTLAAVAACVVPMFRSSSSAGEDYRVRENLAILRQQAEDLERDRAEGRIDQDEYEETRLELERRVLEETRSDAEESRSERSRMTRICAAAAAIVIPVLAGGIYSQIGRYEAVDPEFIAMVNEHAMSQRGHSAAEMNQKIEELKKHLEDDPSNAQGWYLLARTAAAVGRFDESVQAYKRLNALVPGNADLMADMADIMAAANGRVITPDVEKILLDALEIDPAQWKALALLAIQSWDRQQYLKAAEYWSRLLEIVPEDFPDIDQIKANIAEAKRLAGVNDSISQSSSEVGEKGSSERIPTAAPAPMKKISGVVSVSDSLRSKVQPSDVVFIYARPIDSKMPVVLTKVRGSDLPFKFTLDDSMAIAMGGESLAQLEVVVVGARISRTGNIMPQSGDLEGELEKTVKVGSKDVEVVISSVR